VSDYLKENLWNAPTSGRSIRRGRSEGKARLIQTLLADRNASIARLKASPNRQSRMRLHSSERDLIDLNGGSPDVTAEYVHDQTVVATIAGRPLRGSVGQDRRVVAASYADTCHTADAPCYR